MGKFKTCRRYNDPGHAHCLTFSCFRGQPFLNSDRSCGWLIEAFDLARNKHRLHIWAYVIMPEHAHLLIWPTLAGYDLSKVLLTVKLPVARKALAFVRRQAPAFLPRMLDRQPGGERHYRFWQRGGGYDRNVFEPATAWEQVEYLHENPVRRGLCAQSHDWPWSSAGIYAGLREGPLRIDFETVSRTRGG